MAASNFDRVMDAVIFPNEGGFVNNPRDPGGATNLGITRATLAAARHAPVSVADVRNLQKDEARKIYKSRYAQTIRFDDLPAGVDCAVLDYAVNSGPARAVKALQKVLDIAQDGVMGPDTLRALKTVAPTEVIRELCAERLAFLKRLSTWSTFGAGWSRRVASVQRVSLSMAKMPVHAALVAEPDEMTDAGAAKARPADTSITATAHGQGVLAAAGGVAATAIGAAKDAIEPYVGLHRYVQYVFVAITTLGLVGVVGGLAMAGFAELRRIRSGAPV